MTTRPTALVAPPRATGSVAPPYPCPWALVRPAVLVLALVAAAGLLGSCSRPRSPATVALPGGAGRGTRLAVAHVIDGDTVDLAVPGGSTERARLLGIDTPETVKPDTPVQCFGPEASARTKALLPAGTAVLVQRDAEARDRYGRILVYLWREADGLFVNGTLVAEGLARTLSIAPNTAHRSDLAATQDAARRAGIGLWAACGAADGEPP